MREKIDWHLAMFCLDVAHLFSRLSAVFINLSDRIREKHKDE